MKALKYLTMLLIASSATSCSQDDSPIADGQGPLHEVQLTFDLKLDSSVGTRASRPLTSADDWQKVSDMRIYVFRSSTGLDDGSFVYYHPKVRDNLSNEISVTPYFQVPEFDKNGEGVWDKSEFEEHIYRIVPMLSTGYYRFLAVGRDDNESSTPLTVNWIEGRTTWKTAVMTNNGNTPSVTEIFTGYPMNADGTPKTIHLTAQESFTEEIMCRRAVAGVFLYVYNIPERLSTEYAWHAGGAPTGAISQDVEKGVECTVDEVAIVAAGFNTDVNLTSRRCGDTFVSDNSRFYMTRLASVNTAGMTPDTELGVYPDPVYAGSFVFPTSLYNSSFTANYVGGEKADTGNFTVFDKSLYLCFFHISGSGQYYPIKMIPIKIVRSYTHDPDSEDICAGDNAISTDGLHYNLVANHLYCLGYRRVKNTMDDPIDLKDAINKPALQIKVIGSWQADVDIEM